MIGILRNLAVEIAGFIRPPIAKNAPTPQDGAALTTGLANLKPSPRFAVRPGDIIIARGSEVFDRGAIKAALNANPSGYLRGAAPIAEIASQLDLLDSSPDIAAPNDIEDSAPVILGEIDDLGHHLVDGADRVRRAQRLGKNTVGAFVLSSAQMNRFRLFRFHEGDDEAPQTDDEPLRTIFMRENPNCATNEARSVQLEFIALSGDVGRPLAGELKDALRDALAVRAIDALWTLRGLGVPEDEAKKFLGAELARRTTHYSVSTLERRSKIAVPALTALDRAQFNRLNQQRGEALKAAFDKFDLARDGAKALAFDLDLIRCLAAAIGKAHILFKGLRDLDKIKKNGLSPSTAEIETHVFGAAKEQKALFLPLRDMVRVALYGYVSPCDLWPESFCYRPIFDLAIFVGMLMSGRAALLRPEAARAYIEFILPHDVHAAPPPSFSDEHEMKSRLAHSLAKVPGLQLVLGEIANRVADTGIPEIVSY